jgi:hypothetical protein
VIPYTALLEATAELFPGHAGRRLVVATDEYASDARLVYEDIKTPPCEYASFEVYECAEPRDVHALAGAGTDMLVVFRALDFRHAPRRILGDGRIAAVTFFSASSTEHAARYIDFVCATDYRSQARFERRFTWLLSRADFIGFVSGNAMQCRAELHLPSAGVWFSLAGSIPPGGQAVLPTGEISLLTDPSGSFGDRGFELDGSVVLRATPIVHRGGTNVTIADTALVYEGLVRLVDEPAVVSLRHGYVTDVQPHEPSHTAGADALWALLGADERYAKIHEIGFGCHQAAYLVRSNFFPNERYAGVHFGLGLGEHTAFHVDLVCPDVSVTFDSNIGSDLLYTRSL